jgi:outer membrane protein assembly factor BamB
MRSHDLCRTGSTKDAGPKSSRLLFTKFVGCGFSSPIVVGGKVYVGGTDGVYALDSWSGEIVWVSNMGVVYSTPSFSNGKVYVGSYDGYAYCLSATNGAQVWKQFIGNAYYFSSPAVDNGVVYIGSRADSPGQAILFALNADTGAEMWRFASGDEYFLSSPSVANNTVFFGAENLFPFPSIYSLNASTGAIVWSYVTKTRVMASPTISLGIAYVGGDNSKFYALNSTTGEEIWISSEPLPDPAYGYQSAASICENIVYVSASGIIRAFNASTGNIIWEHSIAIEHTLASPTVADGIVYVGSGYGTIYALNAFTGETIWQYYTGGRPIHSSPAVSSGSLYLCSTDGYLYAFRDLGSKPPIIIDQPEYTWYGDFVVNNTDTVIIRNSNFTVVGGDVKIYGSLIAQNSILRILRNSCFKYIHVYGDLSIEESEIVGSNYLIVGNPGRIRLLDSVMPTTSIVGQNTFVNISKCSVAQIASSFGEILVYDSNVTQLAIEFLLTASWTFSNSSIGEIELLDPDGTDLELRTGYIQSLSLLGPSGFNFTLLHSSVDKWIVEFAQNFLLTARLTNSNIESLVFSINCAHEPIDLTLKNGFIQYQRLFIENNIDLTVGNSTINEWSVVITEEYNPECGHVNISDSIFSAYIRSWGSLNFTVSNSTVEYLHAGTERYYGSGDLSILLSDSVVNTLGLAYSIGSTDLELNEGYQQYVNLCSEQQCSNITLTRTVVNHWGVETTDNAIVRIQNSTLTGMHPNPSFSGLDVLGNSSIYIYNSNVTGGFVMERASLILSNSTLSTVWCYDSSNLTAINSTIGILITDPPIVTLIDSVVLARIELPMTLSSDQISSSFQEECPTPLPSYINRTSKYIQISIIGELLSEARVKIFYDENAVREAGISEASLMIYYLNQSSGEWQPPPIQGVNASQNYVWANVTSFSYFTLGDGGSSALPGDINTDGIVDIFDITIVATQFGRPPPPITDFRADVNSDGIVDIFDLVVVALHFGETS